jgi:SPP1 family predicted phage head-tail adaptor
VSEVSYDPGWLRHRVSVERPTDTGDGAGGEAVTWSTLAELWARIEPVTAKEEAVAGHMAGVLTHTITLRWRDDITGTMRVTWHGRAFRILAVYDPDETQRYLVAETAEETA